MSLQLLPLRVNGWKTIGPAPEPFGARKPLPRFALPVIARGTVTRPTSTMRSTWLAVLSLILLPSTAAALPERFAAPYTVMGMANPGEPYLVVLGDWNGDGRPDMAVNSAGFVSVMIGVGNGTFLPPQTIPGITAGQDMAAGDMQGDGADDLVIQDGNQLRVVLNPASATPTISSQPVSSTWLHLAIGDMNHDGKLDVISTDEVGNMVSVILGNGNGTLGTRTDYPTPGPSRFVLADFTADGRLDVITLNFGTLSLWHGAGNGTLFNRDDIPLPAGPAYNEILPVDMNNDGLLDLVLKTDGAGLGVLNATGAGDFGSVTFIPCPSATHLTKADFNEDGKQDLFLSLHDPSLTLNGCLYYGTGFGFSGPSYYRGGGFATYCATGDLNQDGHADVVLTCSPQEVTVWLGHGNATFGDGLIATTSYIGADSTGGDVAIAEMTGDGNPDLVLSRTINASGARAGIDVLAGDGAGHFGPMYFRDTATENAGLAVADLDGDGVKDVATTKTAAIVTFHNLGGVSGLAAGVQAAAVAQATSIAAGDLNHDGKPELVTGNRSGGGDISVFLNSGTGSFSHFNEYSFASPRVESGVAIADMNGDTHPDVVTVSDGVVGVFNGNGTGALSVGTQSISVAPGARALTLADLNQDGRPDIAVAGSGEISVILNAGGGSFQPVVAVAARGEHRAIAARDVNQDGLLDLCLTNDTEGSVSVLLGNGAGAFSQSFIQWGAGFRPSGLAVGDFTGDGLADLAVVQDSYVEVLSNLGGTPPYNPGPSVRAPDMAYVADGGTLKFDVTAMDLNGDPIDGMFAAPLGSASFVVNPSHTLGTYTWSPVTSDIGFASVTFSAFNSGGFGNASTSMEVVPSGSALTGRLVWTPGVEVAGTFQVCFGATNQAGDTTTVCTTVTVAPPGGSARAAGSEPRTAARSTSSAPTLSAPSSVAGLAGQPVSFGVWASSATSLFVNTSGLPAGARATFATDAPPAVSAPSIVYASPGNPVTVNVTVNDPEGNVLSLLADRSAFPASNMPSFTTNGSNTTGTLTWTPAAADNGKSFGITFRAANALWTSRPTLIQVGLRPTVYYKENSNPNEESGGSPLQPLTGASFAYAAGRLGQGADFDGTSSHAIGITPGVQYDFTTNFTAECWVKARPPVPSANSMVLIARGATQGVGGVWPNWHFEVYGTSAGSLTGMVRFAVEPGAGFFVNSTHRVDDGNFHHLAATYDGVTIRLYLDGALEGSTAASGLSVGMVNGLFQVGGGARVGTTSLPLNGTVDEIRVWHVLRSQPEIQNAKDAELFTTITAVEETAPVLRTALAPNCPNPFNPRTDIRFELARESHVRLRVFDVSGRLVRQLIDSTLPAGVHRAFWDGTDSGGRASASGTYLYRLDAAGFNQSRKMVLLR